MGLNICVDIVHTLHTPAIAAPGMLPAGSPFSPIMLAVHIGLVVLIAFEWFAIISYWLGRFWGRWFILVGCVFYLTGLKDLHRDWIRSHFAAEMNLYGALLALFLLWYLHTHDVRAWFARSRAAAAAKGK